MTQVVSGCCHAEIVGGARMEFPLGGTTWGITYKIDCCSECGKEVEDYAEVCECCGEINCHGTCEDSEEEEISTNACW